MSKLKVYLSPSNQYGNLYAYGNTNEMKVCNAIADATQKALLRNSFDVKKAKEGQAMYTSIAESNAWNADLHICIHTNAGGGNGTIVFVYDKATSNMKYANAIYESVSTLRKDSKKVDYGVRTYAELAECNATSAICVYVEVDFHDNKSIAKWLIENTEEIGNAIAEGVCNACGVTFKTANTKPVTGQTKKLYRVQVGAFTDKTNVDNCVKKLHKAGFKDTIIKTEEVKT